MSELSHTVSLRFGPKHSWCHNVTVDLLVIDCVSPFIEFSDLCKSSKICTKELEKCLLWKHEYQNLITQNPHKKTRNTDTLTHWHTHITPGLERQGLTDQTVQLNQQAAELVRDHVSKNMVEINWERHPASASGLRIHMLTYVHRYLHIDVHTQEHTQTHTTKEIQKTKSCVSSVKKDQWALIKAWMLHFSGGVLWARVTAYWGWSTLFFFRVSLKHNS